MNVRIPHFFSSEDIALLMNDPTIAFHKEKPGQVHFSIAIPDTIQAKLNMNITTVPMTWVRGDTVEHVDHGESPFDHTYVIYLTDSPGQFLVDGQSYPIEAGAAHLFSRLPHSTLHAEERLIMGPMSEKGLPVGLPPTTVIVYFPSDRMDVYMVYESYSPQVVILNIPPPVSESLGDYYVYYINDTGVETMWNPPAGKKFGGWKLLDYPENIPIGDNPVDKIYMPGEIYNYTSTTLLTPNWIDVTKRFGLHFNDNTVFYKQNSLSTGSGGVRNYRAKQRKT